ncbi:transporter bos1 [Ophiostoma piceae UAMH 11346]|uniref:Protein transport protein BOS1 n=1 Tax=Ophiostoma piceae (strain UAMH 11346) TaxID=1262450 RepID=S3CBN6_OPHP1|nr:transporter bos1 [Ophiostoma piceae UAMH 11346]
MNTSFNSALKQSTSIRKELSVLASAINSSNSSNSSDPSDPNASAPPTVSPAQFGTLSASLTAFTRTVDEYNALARQELNPAKQEKAYDRIRNFRTELGEFRAQFDALKTARDDAAHQMNRAELLGRRPYAQTPENPYAASQGGGAGGGGGTSTSGGGAATAEPCRQQSVAFFSSTNSALDDYIARGQAVLGDLSSQREMLKSTQRKMYTVANTLGVSGDTIRMIERRAREDKWIFWACVVVFVLFCWLVLHYLR